MPDEKPDLPALRARIDAVDRELLERLAERCRLSGEVIRAKGPGELRDPGREQQLLARLVGAGRELGLDAHFVASVFHELIAQSLRLQQSWLQGAVNEGTRVASIAYMGGEGSWGHRAAQRSAAREDGDPELCSHDSFHAAARAVQRGEADLCVLPIENTTTGGIAEVFDLLASSGLHVVGEEVVRIEHVLAALPGATEDRLRVVLSHPQALAQCRRRLDALPAARAEPWTSTAGAAAEVARRADPGCAALCSAEAAQRHGLVVLRAAASDEADNFTRFVALAREGRVVDQRIPCKTSLVLSTAQRAGALVEALLVFREHGLNLTRLESRPIPGNPWEELFHVDFHGNVADPNVARALDALGGATRYLRCLGSYPSDSLPPTPLGGEAARPLPPREAPTGRVRVVDVGPVSLGGEGCALIAGPADPGDEAQLASCARLLREHGLPLLHSGGPGGPAGEAFVAMASRVAREHGLALALGAGRGEGLEERARLAQLLCLDPADMSDPALLAAVGALPVPLLLRRERGADPREWLAAAGRVRAAGNHQLLLCEAGVEVAGGSRTLDLGALARLREQSGIPVVADPQRAAAGREEVLALARAAVAAGADALWFELPSGEDEARRWLAELLPLVAHAPR